MTVAELIEELKKMPQDVDVLVEGNMADKVLLENCKGNEYVRIFQTWDIELTGRFGEDK